MSWNSAKSSETSGKWVSFSGCVCGFQGKLCRIAPSVLEKSLKSRKDIKSHANNLTFSYCVGQGSPEKRNICASILSLFSRSVVSDSLLPHRLQHTRLPCPSPTPGVYSDSCPWCHPTISSSVIPFSSGLQSSHRGLFQWVSSLHEVARVLEFQHQSFQWTPRTDLL